MIHHFWGSSPSRRRDGWQRSAGVYPTRLSWRRRKEPRGEQSCAETLPHVHMCLYIHTYTLIYVHIYKYTQLYGYICVHITRTKMSQGASFFVVFSSLSSSRYLSAAGARPEKHETQSGLSPRERRAAAREWNSLGNMVVVIIVVITTNSNSGKRRRPLAEKAKRLHTFPTSAQKGGETHSRVLSPRRRPAHVAAGVSRNAREGESAAVE